MKKLLKTVLLYLLFFLVLNSLNAAVTLCQAGNICSTGICASGLCIDLIPFSNVRNVPTLLAVGCGNVGNASQDYCEFSNIYNREYDFLSYNFLGETVNIFNTLNIYQSNFCFVEDDYCDKKTGKIRTFDGESIGIFEDDETSLFESVYFVENPLFVNLSFSEDFRFLPLRVPTGQNQLKFLLSCKSNSSINIYFLLNDELIRYLNWEDLGSSYNVTYLVYNQTNVNYNLSMNPPANSYGPWKEVTITFETKFSDIAIAFEKNGNCRISFLRINNSFPQYSEVEGYPIYDSRVNKLLNYFEQPYPTGICKKDQCWNGFGCVENNSLMYSIDGIKRVAKCHNGSIVETRISFDRNYEYIDYCLNDGCLNSLLQCVPEFTWEDGMICMDGQWIHDTDFGARLLLNLKTVQNYTLYCDKNATTSLKLEALFLNIDNPNKIRNYCIFIGNITKNNDKIYSTHNILILFLNESNIEFRKGFEFSEDIFFTAINFSRINLGSKNSNLGEYIEYTNSLDINQIYGKFGKPIYVYFFNKSNMLIISSVNFSNNSFKTTYSSFKTMLFNNVDNYILINDSISSGYYYFSEVEISPEIIFIKNVTSYNFVLAYKNLLLYDNFNFNLLSKYQNDYVRPYLYLRRISLGEELDNDYFVTVLTSQIIKIEKITHFDFLRYVIGHESLE